MSAPELKAEILREIWHYHWPRHGKRHRRDPSEPFADLSETYAADSRDSPVEPAAKHQIRLLPPCGPLYPVNFPHPVDIDHFSANPNLRRDVSGRHQ